MLKKFLKGFGYVAIFLTLLPLIPSDYWWIRMFDFPHIQLTALTFIAILTFYIKFDIKNYRDYIFLGLMIVCFIFQFSKLLPYTPFYKYEVLDNTQTNSKKFLKLFTANVLQDNKENQKLVSLINTINADVMVFTEADSIWLKAIRKNLPTAFKYKVEVPLGNTYGMLMYSKLPLIDPAVHFMVDDSIPSIHTKLVLQTGETIQLFALHPTPPMPQENPLSTDRDAELMMTAKLARESEIPVIIVGDFNDVAWSSTSTLFRHASNLLDVRVGRGFFSTFNAKKMILRWPLDHIYVSPEFRLATIKSCDGIDSDHFPFYVELSFEPNGAHQQKPTPATKEELEKAHNQIEHLKEEESKEKSQ